MSATTASTTTGPTHGTDRTRCERSSRTPTVRPRCCGPPSVDVPAIAADEVLVEVHAAGLDRGVWHLMTGTPYLVRLRLRAAPAQAPRPRPRRRRPGGRRRRRRSPGSASGDEVFGIAAGSFAEYAAAKEGKLALQAGRPHARAGGRRDRSPGSPRCRR